MNDKVISTMQPKLQPQLPPQPLAADARRSSEARPPSGGTVGPPAQSESGQPLPQAVQETREQPSAPAVEQDLNGVVESLNDYLQSVERDLMFSVDENSGRTIITVMDRQSQEVIRQIPPEAVVALAEYLRDEGGLESMGIVERA